MSSLRYEGIRDAGRLPGGFPPGGPRAMIAPRPGQHTAGQQTAGQAAQISQFFFDLRSYLGVSPHQVAAQLKTHPLVIEALENAELRSLPHWPETSRIVLGYTDWAGVDGRPVLAALANLLNAAQPRPVEPRPFSGTPQQFQHSVARLRQAGVVLAAGARKLPEKALSEARARPARTFYAVSLPMAFMVLALNTSIVQGAVSRITKPVTSFASSIRDAFAVHFAPVREGLRWIEVEDPRTRRGDKLADGER